jgi:hypothetical protein
VDDVSSPAVVSNNLSNINALGFYHEMRWNVEFADIEQRWQQHVNEFFAEQGMPDEFFYEPQESGQEPRLVLDTEHARVYAAWLATKGHITDAEHQWLARDIQQREKGGHDELTQ